MGPAPFAALHHTTQRRFLHLGLSTIPATSKGGSQGHPYTWPEENQLLTTITRGTCKQCGFYEDRLIPFVRVRPWKNYFFRSPI